MRAVSSRRECSHALFLGDLTEQKDRHSAVLVNRLCSELAELADIVDVIILKGNHDFVDELWPFFGFVTALTEKRIRFISKPTSLQLPIGRCLFLPCTKDWEAAWRDLDLESYQFIFTHQTYSQSVAENKFKLDGVPSSFFAHTKAKVWSGDVHGPQKVSRNVEYVGSPYRCRFGDDADNRVVLQYEDHHENLKFTCKNKHLVVVRSLGELKAVKGINPDDQVKVRFELTRAQLDDWRTIRGRIVEYAAKEGWELFGPDPVRIEEEDTPVVKGKAVIHSGVKSPIQVTRDYAKLHKVSGPMLDYGLNLAQEAQETKHEN